MWRYFREFSTARRNWLIPDHVREDGVAAERLSPTNLGFLLNARVAAVHLGHLTVDEFARETRLTLDGMRKLPLVRGHVPNWTDVETCGVLDPMFVSTVDSGNLAASLWTLKQAALAFARQAPPADRLWSGIRDLARLLATPTHPGAQALADRVLRVDARLEAALPQLEEAGATLRRRHGCRCRPTLAAGRRRDVVGERAGRASRRRRARGSRRGLTTTTRATSRPSSSRSISTSARWTSLSSTTCARRRCRSATTRRWARWPVSTYDLLASEARIAAFVAIAKGDVPAGQLVPPRAHPRRVARARACWRRGPGRCSST